MFFFLMLASTSIALTTINNHFKTFLIEDIGRLMAGILGSEPVGPWTKTILKSRIGPEP